MKKRLPFFLSCLLFFAWLPAQTWTDVPTNVLFDFQDVDIVGGGHAFAIGISNSSISDQVLHTSDEGSTWTPISMGPFANQQIRGIEFVSANSGFVNILDWSGSSYQSRLYRTHDQGANWTEVTPLPSTIWSGNSNVIFTDSLNGFFVLEDTVFKTTDGGDSWTNSLEIREYYTSEDVEAWDANHIVLGLWDGTFAYKGAVLATSNGGASWDTTYFPGTYSQIRKITTGSDSTIFAVSGGGFATSLPMYKSVDFGQSWDTITLDFLGDSSVYFTDIYFVSGLRGYISTSPGQIYESLDGGYTWSQVFVDSTTAQLTCLDFHDGLGLAGGDYGGLAKTFLPLARVSPKDMDFSRIWPNPCENQLSVEVEFEGISTLRVLDLRGRILVPEREFRRQTSLDLDELKPGTYLLEIQSRGNRQVRKIVHI